MRIALVLGSGSARGMSHIGVIRALSELHVDPAVVVGCSVGAMVGASYLNNNLDKLETWATGLSRRNVRKYFDLNLSLTGFVHRDRMQDFFADNVCPPHLLNGQLRKPFATVATDLSTGEEVWLKSGEVQNMVWASMSYPGLFPAFALSERWLVDGGLINPVPVSLAKALGVDFTIAVNLNSGLSRRHKDKLNLSGEYRVKDSHAESDTVEEENESPTDTGFFAKARQSIKSVSNNWLSSSEKDAPSSPKVFDVISSSMNIMQERLTRSRLVGDPPDILLNPRLSDIGLLELHRSAEAIEEGYACVMRMRSEIEFLLENN